MTALMQNEWSNLFENDVISLLVVNWFTVQAATFCVRFSPPYNKINIQLKENLTVVDNSIQN